jgi:hypothetical protein
MSATSDDAANSNTADTASTGKTASSAASSSTTTGTAAGATPTAAQAAAQLKTTLTAADTDATQHIQSLGLVHQARLSQATRTAAALTTQYGASDPRVQAAQASVTAIQTTAARVSLVSQQLAAPAVQVASTGWALQGFVLNAQLQPAARFTVFLVDADKTYLRQYGFAYTDDTGYFLINYAGATGQTQTATQQLFVEIANTDAKPVYLSSTAFQPVLGTATFQNIVLPAGEQPIGDPPPEIRAVALPHTKKQKTTRPKTSNS